MNIIKDKTKVIWNKNLFAAECINFKSEKIPNTNMRKEKSIKDLKLWLKKYNIPKKTNIPPVNGIFIFEANFWCLSPVMFIRIFYFINYSNFIN